MDKKQLEVIAKALVAEGKGILAADESTATAGKRLASIGMENTEENRRDMREMLFSTKGVAKYISGVILYEETLSQSNSKGIKFVDEMQGCGVIPGIKVDLGLEGLAGHRDEQVTKGLSGLEERLTKYYKLGARFAKWRAVYAVDDHIPSKTCIEENALRLAKYAKACQEAGIVPIVEPEVMMDGKYTKYIWQRCYEVTVKVQKALFTKMSENGVYMPGILLKPNMIVAGQTCSTQPTPKQVAEATVKCLKETVPLDIAGIVFLSGGQSDDLATKHLGLMNKIGELPWKLSYSYGRALQAAALKAWGGKKENIVVAQEVFMHRAYMNSLASCGKC